MSNKGKAAADLMFDNVVYDRQHISYIYSDQNVSRVGNDNDKRVQDYYDVVATH